MSAALTARLAAGSACAAAACTAAFIITRRHKSSNLVYCGTDRTLEELGKRIENCFQMKLPTGGLGGHSPNASRAVTTGHWIPARTEGLSQPYMVVASRDFCDELNLDFSETRTKRFIECFAGRADAFPRNFEPWACPYGVSVHGQWLTSSPYGVYGYGDGRAITLCDVQGVTSRWELQLKGGGRTAFARNFDGRSTLRSSIREFLASEAMHHLGVPTTRALCTIATDVESVARAWYPGSEKRDPMDKYAAAPRMGVEEQCAITCRAAPSFLRVGQFELFYRTRPQEELTALFEYALDREFPTISKTAPLKERALQMFEEFSARQASLMAEWMRVGYVQGNMNSDNCLLNGRTLDYGPFGTMEKFDLRYQPFTSDPMGNYCYMQQPLAGKVNLASFAGPILGLAPERESTDWKDDLQKILDRYLDKYEKYHHENCKRKLGLVVWDASASESWTNLLVLMQKSSVDFTLLFRHLIDVALQQSADDAFKVLEPAFYEVTNDASWKEWIRGWQQLCVQQGPGADRLEQMRKASPKFIPRNWMLLLAYEAAQKKDFSICEELEELFRNPYAEGTEEQIRKWYRKTPEWAQGKGGVAFMS
eukprot:GEMP01011179.1.p1 GENE.GEMP01011179.1~~GEMP01011179.1.p1  ORF type:complete len:595 (+),score=144.16 GEMP01011179.1:152-1936(+)